MNKIYLAADHAGFELKKELKKFIQDNYQNFEIIDLGCDSTISCDYSDYAQKLAYELKDSSALGLLICGSGIGISIAVNRFAWVRAALCHNEIAAQLAREHNDANVLVLGARFNNHETNLRITKVFLDTEFEQDPRHIKRIQKLNELK